MKQKALLVALISAIIFSCQKEKMQPPANDKLQEQTLKKRNYPYTSSSRSNDSTSLLFLKQLSLIKDSTEREIARGNFSNLIRAKNLRLKNLLSASEEYDWMQGENCYSDAGPFMLLPNDGQYSWYELYDYRSEVIGYKHFFWDAARQNQFQWYVTSREKVYFQASPYGGRFIGALQHEWSSADGMMPLTWLETSFRYEVVGTGIFVTIVGQLTVYDMTSLPGQGSTTQKRYSINSTKFFTNMHVEIS